MKSEDIQLMIILVIGVISIFLIIIGQIFNGLAFFLIGISGWVYHDEVIKCLKKIMKKNTKE